MCQAALPGDEHDAEDGCDRQRPHDPRVRPSIAGRLDDSVGERHQGHNREDCPDRIHRDVPGRFGLGDDGEGRDDPDRDHRDVDHEDGRPGEVLEQEAAQDRAGHDRQRRGSAPHGDRLGPLPLVEDVGDDRERRGHCQRCAQTHEGAQGDELAGTAHQRRESRAESKEAHAHDQHPPPAESIGESAGHEQQTREHERVGIDHPLQLAGVRPQVVRQNGQGNHQNRVVHADAEQGQDQHGENRPPAQVPMVRRGHRVAPFCGRVADGRSTGRRRTLLHDSHSVRAADY